MTHSRVDAMRPLAALLLCVACAHAPAAPPAMAEKRGSNLLDPVYGRGLEGDMLAGMRLLHEVTEKSLDEKERATRQCLLERFEGNAPAKVPPGTDPWMVSAVALYQRYWRPVLLQEKTPAEGEALLFEELKVFLGRPELKGLDEALDALDAQITAHGYHAILGVTQPYHELMAWKTEEPTTYQVSLLDRTMPVKVVLMRDFATLGWSGYATCERAFSGGWTNENGLYCVAESYDLTSEHFNVSYLAHEGQHFSDHERFPKLEQPELEYRAKLVELALAKSSLAELLQRFETEGGGTRASPHSFANGHVVRDVGAEVHRGARPWAEIPVADINAAAAALYRRNTEALQAAGAAEVARILPP
jgi:hypothetical protein